MAQIVKKIGEKEVGFKFTMLTITKYCEMRNIPFSEYDKDMASNVFITSNTLLRAAIEVYTRGEETPSEYDVDDLFSQITQKDYQDIIKCYAEGMNSAFSLILKKTPEKKAGVKKK